MYEIEIRGVEVDQHAQNMGPVLPYCNLSWQSWEECQTNNSEEQQNSSSLTVFLKFPDCETVHGESAEGWVFCKRLPKSQSQALFPKACWSGLFALRWLHVLHFRGDA